MPRLSIPHALLMIRPVSFGYNEETASTNAFQQTDAKDVQAIQKAALEEFDVVVQQLRQSRIELIILPDVMPPKPDAIFPNNWISTLPDGTVVLYPMLAVNRRFERRADVLTTLGDHYVISRTLDYSAEESNQRFLEGTGSIVFDHGHQVAYACRSERTNESLLLELCNNLGYRAIVFDAADENDRPIYHTNVVMWIGQKKAVLCLDAIKNELHQDQLLDQLAASGHKVVAISYEQMRAFSGNMYEVQAKDGQVILLMSSTAYQSLLPGQLHELSKLAEPLVVNIPTIERYGGGGIRCMVAGIYLQKKGSY